jgi:hypothetical protein
VLFSKYAKLVVGYFVYGAARETSFRIHGVLKEMAEPNLTLNSDFEYVIYSID